MTRKFRFETVQLHAGQTVDPTTKSRAVPIYQTTSYVFDDTTHAANLFALKEPGNIYTRIMNPTTDVLEQRMAQLEGGVGALAVSSGSSAITYAIMNIASAGDHIVSASTIYGGTYNLFTHTLPKYGITTTLIDSDNLENFSKAINENTKAIFIETIGNPNANVADIEGVANIAHENGIPLIIDNTFGTPYLVRPIEFGADIVIHSATKYLGGHGTSIGGVIVDGGNFDWAASGKFPDFTTPDTSYNGIVYAKDIGAAAFIIKARVGLLRDTGACLSPFNAFLLLQGIETLSLRVERHIENTKRIVDFLNSHDEVTVVNYPSLEGNLYYDLAEKYLPKGAGAIFTFRIKGGKEKALAFIDRLELFSQLANVADSKSLVIHPATTTHGQLGKNELEASGIYEDTIRLSIGTEHIEDLLEDLENGFKTVKN